MHFVHVIKLYLTCTIFHFPSFYIFLYDYGTESLTHVSRYSTTTLTIKLCCYLIFILTWLQEYNSYFLLCIICHLTNYLFIFYTWCLKVFQFFNSFCSQILSHTINYNSTLLSFYSTLASPQPVLFPGSIP